MIVKKKKKKNLQKQPKLCINKLQGKVNWELWVIILSIKPLILCLPTRNWALGLKTGRIIDIDNYKVNLSNSSSTNQIPKCLCFVVKHFAQIWVFGAKLCPSKTLFKEGLKRGMKIFSACRKKDNIHTSPPNNLSRPKSPTAHPHITNHLKPQFYVCSI